MKTLRIRLSPNTKHNVLLDGVAEEDLKLLDEPTYENMSKLGIEYADAVIQGSDEIDPNLAAYVQDKNKLFLNYQSEETYIDAYNDFYDKVL